MEDAEVPTTHSAEGGTLDEYGFSVHPEFVAAYKETSLLQAERRLALREQWKVLMREMREEDHKVEIASTSQQEAVKLAGERTRAARKFLRGPVVHGIPPEYRPYAWPLLCGVEKARHAKGEHVFPSMLQRCEGKDRNKDLDLDLDRTFPGHPLLDRESANGAAGTASLHHVLNSYALYNPEVGYCQSMNFIAGILLIMDVREEDSFWIISHVSDSLLPNYFAPPMLGAQVDNKVFKVLLQRHLPALAPHLAKIGLDPAMICSQWFLCIFCNKMPSETVCRIWDLVFCKGPQAIFQVALAIFKICEPQLLDADDMGAGMEAIRHYELGCFNADELLECAVLNFGNIGDVGKLREDFYPEAQADHAEYKRRTANYQMHQNIRKGKQTLQSVGSKLSGFSAVLGQTMAETKSQVEKEDWFGQMKAQATSASGVASVVASSFFSTFSSAPSSTSVPLNTNAPLRTPAHASAGVGRDNHASAGFWKEPTPEEEVADAERAAADGDEVDELKVLLSKEEGIKVTVAGAGDDALLEGSVHEGGAWGAGVGADAGARAQLEAAAAEVEERAREVNSRAEVAASGADGSKALDECRGAQEQIDRAAGDRQLVDEAKAQRVAADTAQSIAQVGKTSDADVIVAAVDEVPSVEGGGDGGKDGSDSGSDLDLDEFEKMIEELGE